MKFITIWQEDKPSHALTNDKPSMTVPDQAMSIPEIIAKFTRTGMLPQSFLKQDEGGQEYVEDSEFSPLDHNPAEFDPKVHQEKLRALKAKSEAPKQAKSEAPKLEPETPTAVSPAKS